MTREWVIFTACIYFLLCERPIRGAADPLDPNRKFYGRLLILITGAGEFISPSIKAQDPEAMDTASKYTYAHFLQFRRTDSQGLPGYSIVIASDPKLSTKLKKLPQRIKDEAGFLGTIPASMDSFNNFLSTDSKLSLLQRALDNFSNEKLFQMTSEGNDSILPLLKVEIVIVSNNVDGAVPLWNDSAQSGTFEEWRQGNGKTLDAKLVGQLRKRFGEAVVQVFITSCEGANIGDKFGVRDQCSCYLSVTDKDALFYPSGGAPPPLAGVIRTKNAQIATIETKFSRVADMASLGAVALNHFQVFQSQVEHDHVGLDPIFASGNRDNPLHSFLYNSADARAEKVLTVFAAQKYDGDRPRRLLAAGFSESLPPRVSVSDEMIKDHPQLKRVLGATENLRRNSYARYLEEPKLQLDSSFSDSMKAFRKCATRQNPQPEVCDSINKIISIAATGKGVEGHQTFRDRQLLLSATDFFADYDSDKADTLIARYNEGTIKVSVLFARLNSLWHKFDTFREEITSYANDHYHNQLPADLESAFKTMKINYQNAFYSVQRQFFPLLRKEALEVRLVRIEETAKLLAIHEQEITALDATEELRQLGNDLACLSAYPVGPAFDAKYRKN